MLPYYEERDKGVKGCKKMFFYLLDAIYNGYVKYSKIINTTKTTIDSFRLNIAEELLEKITLPNYKTRGCSISGVVSQHLLAKNWLHFPKYVPPSKSKECPQKGCHVCFQHQLRKDIT
ncbi:piggyBac transposable element-derived protein 4 [Trichonephila clavipes]|nr:piggyBac transposable element-derived protein 4 [Trichonephila clavipes]